ncbi:MAG: hypothetical protein KQH59_03785 [Desulfobulbaceae bacterium]|nr:hypothetical protein [Desulfobulbaceae bacterium]
MKQLRIISLIIFLLSSAGLAIDGTAAPLGTVTEKPATVKQVPPTMQSPQKKTAAPPAVIKPASPPLQQMQRTETPTSVADLVIRSFSCSPATIKAGSSTTLRAVVANVGTAKALDVEIGFYLDGKKIATHRKLVVEPKRSVPATATFRPEQSGRLNLEARVDSREGLQKANRKQHVADAQLIVSKPRQPMQLKPGPPSLTEMRKPGTIAPTRPTESIADAATLRPLPADLSVAQLRYHDDPASLSTPGTHSTQPGISFVLRNNGPAHLDQHQYRRSLVRLLVDNKPLPGYTRMEQLADYAKLGKPGSQFTVVIPGELAKRVPVAITVNSNDSVFELDKNNNTDQTILGPSAAQPQTGTRLDSVRQKNATDRLHPASSQITTGSNAGKDSNRNHRTRPRPQLGLNHALPTPQTTVPEATPKMLDLGIEITSPSGSDTFLRGRSIPIRYRFSRPVAPGGSVVFSAIRTGVGGEEATMSIRNDNPPGPGDPYREVQLQLPADAPTGLYLLSVSHADSAAAGLSDMFHVTSLDAYEVGGDDEAIGDGGGFGGSGEAGFHFTPFEVVEIVGDDPPIGDGGAFGGPGAPTLSLVTPRAGSHIVESERDGRLRMDLSWRYHGPLASLPEHWQMELIDPTTDEVVRSENLACLEARDSPASETQPLPSRTCQASYVDDTLSGSYRLRISGAGLEAETAGIIHWGVDVDRPFISLYTHPRIIIQGEQIPVNFQFRPARSDIVIELFRDGERAYTHVVPRLSCGILDETDVNGYGTSDWCEHDIATDTLEPGINNYLLVVRSLTTGVGREAGPFSIQEPPFSETDENSADFRLAGLRVSEEGLVQVYTAITPAATGGRVLSYRLAFLVGKTDEPGRYQRVERNVPASGGWVDLGHINGFTTAEDRAAHSQLAFTVIVNQPVEIVEPTYDNNRTTDSLRIRSSDTFCRLRAHPGSTFYDGDAHVLHYEIDQFRQVITEVDIICTDFGFNPSAGTGSVAVTQIIRSIPGELGNREETVSLGRKAINLATAASVVGEADTKRISLFSGGIDWPRYGDGELRLTLGGNLFFSRSSHRQQFEVSFRYRR